MKEAVQISGLVKYKVGFRISDDNLDPSELTKVLQLTPDKAHRKGDPNTYVSKRGKLINYSPFNTGLWAIYSHEEECAVLEQHIKSLLLRLYPLKDLLAELTGRCYKMDMFCGAFTCEAHQPGFEISSDILLQLGELNIALGVCIYPV